MHDTSQYIGEVFYALCKTVDTPVSLGSWLRYKYREFSQLVSAAVNPADYEEPRSFARDYLVTEYLSKIRGLETGYDLKEIGLSKFKLAEEKNVSTNRRIRESRSAAPAADVASVLHTAQRIIARVLGPLNEERIFSSSRWSPGATSTLSRRHARVDRKMISLPIAVTRRALPYFRRELHADLHWCAAILNVVPEGPFCFVQKVFGIVDENRVVTVPKNAKTDRVIAAEPTANIFLQKGVGSYIRRRLRSHGVDLDDQSVNQSMSRIAHAFSYATIDLSMASDTVSVELVYDLLPVEWAIFLDDLRSPYGKLPDGSRVKYEKFSSMGNGYTFELESLIFIALCRAVESVLDVRSPSFVYGDDIVTPRECWPLLKTSLEHCGFSANAEKTHADGLFFESCGKHFFGGIDVTPVYQKEIPTSLPSWIRAGNRLIRSHDRHPYVESAWSACRRFGGGQQFAIPVGVEGDDGWVLPISEFNPVDKCRNRGFKCRVIRFLPTREKVDEQAFYAYQLRKNAETGSSHLSWIPVSDPPRPFDGRVTRDNDGNRYRGTHRWVIPPWAEAIHLR